MTTQTEALDMITKLQLAHQAMEAACIRIDQLKAENKTLKEALAQPEEEEKLHPVHIGVDVTKEGTAVTAFYRKPNAVMEMFYSQFHPLAQPEQESVEDLQAKLKWATEQLEANINWEFVAAAKEEMLKAAWAEIKELREQIKEPEQEPLAYRCVVIDVDYSMDTAAILIQDNRDYEFNDGQYWLSTTPPQRKPLPYEKVADLWLARFDTNEYDEVFMNFARAIEAAHGIKE